MGNYYDGSALLAKKDINGNTPELFLCTTNRTGGKTTWFTKKLIDDYNDHGHKFLLLYRFNYELDELSKAFFSDVKALFFPQFEMTDAKFGRGLMAELYFNDGISTTNCGYAVTLNSADTIKKKSHLFADVHQMYMDEFQSETDHYCENEIRKFISIHTSVARGRGKQVRYVPVYLIGNTVSLLNPYYVALGISDRLRSDTRFLRGDGWVCEQGFVQSAADAQETSAFMRAFSAEDYQRLNGQSTYLNDATAFIERPKGRGFYRATVKYMGEEYGILEYKDQGYMYASTKVDNTWPVRYTLTTDDHNINYLLLSRPNMDIVQWRYLFDKGAFRFQNLKCKKMVLDLLRY